MNKYTLFIAIEWQLLCDAQIFTLTQSKINLNSVILKSTETTTNQRRSSSAISVRLNCLTASSSTDSVSRMLEAQTHPDILNDSFFID